MNTSHAAHPDRLLPVDPTTRAIARRLLAHVEDLPVISPHGHLDPAMFVTDEPFPDPTTLLITPDHYVTRVLHSAGVDLADLGVGGSNPDVDKQAAWRIFQQHWPLYAGTASGYWLEQEFEHVFGIHPERLNTDDPDDIYAELSEVIARPDFRPRALADTFGLEVLATTDDPLDDLAAHRTLAADPTFSPRVLPTFRPDAYTKMYNAGFAENVEKLIDVAGDGQTGYAGYLQALRNRRAYFLDHGATSADHGTHDADTTPLDDATAQRLFDKGRAGTATRAEAAAFEANMTYRFAEMSRDDGLVMTLHPGAYRNHSASAFARFGADTGHDIPFALDYTRGLQPLLVTSAGPDFTSSCSPWTDGLLPRARPPRRLLPQRLPRCPLVVHRRDRRHEPLPGRHHRRRRFLPLLRLHRRHPRLLLHPGAPQHLPPRRRRLPRPPRRRAPSHRGPGRRHHRRPDRLLSPKGVQAVTALNRTTVPSPTPPVRIVHGLLGAFHRAHQVWYTQQAEADGHPGGGTPPSRARAMHLLELAAQDGLYTLVTRSGDGDSRS